MEETSALDIELFHYIAVSRAAIQLHSCSATQLSSSAGEWAVVRRMS